VRVSRTLLVRAENGEVKCEMRSKASCGFLVFVEIVVVGKHFITGFVVFSVSN